jgi:multidrug efflux pump
MKISDLSVRRPVLATVMNLLVILAGIWAFRALPVREYPDVELPVVTVQTTYVGASAHTIENTLTVPLEEAINGVNGIRTIRSTSALGASNIEIELTADRDIDLAAMDIQNAIQAVLGRLPPAAERPVVQKAQSGSRSLIWLVVQSERHSPADLSDIADRVVKTPLQVVPGVASIIIGGQRRYAMRVWLDPERMATRNIDPDDVRRAIVANNLQLPAGRIEGQTRQFVVLANAQIDDPRVYERIIVHQNGDGTAPVRLGDIGSVELGASNYNTITRFNGRPSIGVGVVRQSRANELDVSSAVHELLPEIRKALPGGVRLDVAVDQTVFVRESLREVGITLGIAFGLVMLVNLFFLRSLATTLIAAVAIPTAVIGVFGVLAVFGYSINVLTLLAIVLAIGLLVDDAIVVLENVYRHQELGEPPLTAALRGTREVAFPVIATSVSLVAVLVPLGLLTGSTGRLFRELAVTIGGAVAISTFVALTLVPMLCSKFLRFGTKHGAVYRGIERVLVGANHTYERSLGWATRNRLATLGLLAVSVVGSVVLYLDLPKQLAPIEDRGRIVTMARAPQGSTLAYTDAALRQAEKVILAVPEVTGAFAAIGLSIGGPPSTSNGLLFTRLKPWGERSVTQQEIVKRLGAQYAGISNALLFAVNPQSLGQRGFSDVEFVVQSSGATLEELAATVQKLVERVRQLPGLVNVDTDLLLDNPQLDVAFNRDRASDLGVTVEQIALSLQLMVAEGRTDEFILRNKQYDVIASLYPSERSMPEQLGRIHVRNAQGQMVPLESLVHFVPQTAPAELKHYGLVRAATITANLAPEASLGDALDSIQRIADEELPEGYGTALAGASREFAEGTTELLFTFVMALLFVYLVLSAQFENFVHSLVILLSVPLATAGALITLWLAGQTMNIFSQIGLVLLIGLVSKNSILLVDYANQHRARGAGLVEAVVEAGKIRFRPILMTSATSVLGAMPLALAAGAGAESRHPIGVAVVGGLVFSTVFTLLVVPVLYLLFIRAAERLGLGTSSSPIDIDSEAPSETST